MRVMTDYLPPFGPEHESPVPQGVLYRGGRHADDDAYIWGEENVDLVVVIETAWDAKDTATLHAITQADDLDVRFREYAESRLKLIGDRYAALSKVVKVVGWIAMEEIEVIKAENAVGHKHTIPILPWEDRE